ncbi:hypothetical protein DFH09DRAFT_1329273 [Mycena vulgaris]|nr:hypothetical protein DFH09DRAFT_1329273 [Mycena vulgaris]
MGAPREILPLCSRVENLYLDSDLFLTRDCKIMPLKRLYCPEHELASFDSCTQITHVELSRVTLPDGDDARAFVLPVLPHLTQLAFTGIIVLPPRALLESLHALMILRDTRGYSTDNWQSGIVTRVDYWARPDAFIAKRESGEIDRAVWILMMGMAHCVLEPEDLEAGLCFLGYEPIFLSALHALYSPVLGTIGLFVYVVVRLDASERS